MVPARGGGMLPVTYLGMPLGAPPKALATWDVVEERFSKRLAMQESESLLNGGRLTLIKKYSQQPTNILHAPFCYS